MATLTGLFQRGTAYYLCIVLPLTHPLQGKYKNGRLVASLGRCTHREAVLKGTIKRAEVLGGQQLAAFSQHQAPPEVAQQSPSGPRLREIYARWKDSKPRSADSLNACVRSVTLYEEFTGNPSITLLSREQGDGFRTWLQQPDRKTTSKTARDRLTWVKSLLKYASRELGLLDKNPWEGIDIDFKTTNKRRPWTEAELQTFFTQDLYTLYKLPKDKKAGADAAYWIPLLGLYTGARVGELAQLRVADVETSKVRPMVSITDEGEGQSVKSQAGVRKVPIHRELIRLGFLQYVAAMTAKKERRLWPLLSVRDGKPGGYFSQWFGGYRKALGFELYPDFHCLRHTVRSQMAEAEVSEQIMDALLGHEVKGSTGAKVYTHRSLQALSKAIEFLHYPALSMPHAFKN